MARHLRPALAAEVVAEAFRAGMLAGFLTSSGDWNGGGLEDQAIKDHIDESFVAYFNAYLSGDLGGS